MRRTPTSQPKRCYIALVRLEYGQHGEMMKNATKRRKKMNRKANKKRIMIRKLSLSCLCCCWTHSKLFSGKGFSLFLFHCVDVCECRHKAEQHLHHIFVTNKLLCNFQLLISPFSPGLYIHVLFWIMVHYCHQPTIQLQQSSIPWLLFHQLSANLRLSFS